MFDQRGTGAGALDCPALQRQMGASDLTVPAPAAVRVRGGHRAGPAVLRHRGYGRRYRGAAGRLGVARLTLTGLYGSYVAEQFALTHPAR